MAIYIWLPGTRLVALFGGAGLHDRHGVSSLAVGIVVDFLLYGLIATVAVRFVQEHYTSTRGQ
jgi:hypothetical protein